MTAALLPVVSATVYLQRDGDDSLVAGGILLFGVLGVLTFGVSLAARER
jgi:hypothetical protein